MHGHDPIFDEHGNDICQALKDIGRFKMIKRTTGISTTDLTGRLLDLLEPEDEEEVKL